MFKSKAAKKVEVSVTEVTPDQTDAQKVERQSVHFQASKGWKSMSYSVFDDKTDDIIYTIDTKFRQPNLVFKRDDKGEKIGSTIYHWTSTKMNLDINNQPVEMKPARLLSSKYTYTSPAFGNKTMTWKSLSKWTKIDYVLLDERDQTIAKCTAPYSSDEWTGTIEFIDPRAKDQRTRDEILMGGVSLMYMAINIYIGVTSATGLG